MRTIFIFSLAIALSSCSDSGVNPITTNTVVITNISPEVTSVNLSPADPDTDDVVTATVTTADTDGDAVTVSYAWSVDGTEVAETSSSLDGSVYFDKHQEIAVSVTPNDGTADGNTVTSDSIYAVNTAPEAPVISITPSAPKAGTDDLSCNVDTDSYDLDDDSISYGYDWDVDGIYYGSVSTVPGTDTTTGEWTCTVTPNDGDEDGASSTAVTSPYEDDYFITFSGGNTGTCCCTGGNVGNSYILTDVSPNLSEASTATIEYWVYLDTYAQYGTLFRAEEDLGSGILGDCAYGGDQYKTHLSWGGGELRSISVATLAAWQHHAAVFDNGTLSYFVDGVLQATGSATSTTTPTVPSDKLYFGGEWDHSNGNNQHQINGSYRSIRISSSARYTTNFTPEETLLSDSDTMNLYKLNEGTGIYVYDSVDATMTGTIVIVDNPATWSIYKTCPL